MGRLLHTGADSSLVQAHWSWRRRVSFVFVRYRRVFEAIIESAAAYSLSSIALLVMFFVSPNVGYTICFYSFSPLMVRRIPCDPSPRSPTVSRIDRASCSR